MAALDTDKNGDLSAEEISRAAVALKTLDKDRNGRLTPNELRPAPRPVIIPPADIVERLLEFDRNSDGKLTRAELPERLKSFFDQVDGSQDGVLTQAELTAFVEKSEAERRKAEERRIEAEQRAGSSAPPPLPAQPGGAGGPAGGHGPSPRVAPAMAALDTDKNGELSAEEIANAAAALKILDKDSDGKLSAEELRPVPLPGPREGGHP
jgi:Ca2+-binding EF-hand superfamily protein